MAGHLCLIVLRSGHFGTPGCWGFVPWLALTAACQFLSNVLVQFLSQQNGSCETCVAHDQRGRMSKFVRVSLSHPGTTSNSVQQSRRLGESPASEPSARAELTLPPGVRAGLRLPPGVRAGPRLPPGVRAVGSGCPLVSELGAGRVCPCGGGPSLLHSHKLLQTVEVGVGVQRCQLVHRVLKNNDMTETFSSRVAVLVPALELRNSHVGSTCVADKLE